MSGPQDFVDVVRFPGAVTLRFEEALAACIEEIPSGKRATCGAVARALGDARAARAVAQWIREHPGVDPLQKVVRADGAPLRSPRGSARIELERLTDDLEAVPLLAELRDLQRTLEMQVRETDEPNEPKTLGGVDVAYEGERAFAAAVVLDAESLDVLETTEVETEVEFPYIPSYLAFRESPAVAAAVRSLRKRPDMLLVDGHGRLHPALFGFACYVGVILEIPTIGIAKHPLAGTPLPPGRTVRDAVPIKLHGRVRGYAWRPPRASRAFYISVGHRVSLDRALHLAQQATRDRYPEPLRLADRASKEGKRKKKGERLASRPTESRRLRSQTEPGI